MLEIAPDVAAACAEMAEVFEPGRRIVGLEALGSGHIHATLRVRYGDGGDDIVLQRLNEHVFPDLDAVTRNVVAVTEHLRARAPEAEVRSVLRTLRTGAGQALARDATGIAWRGYVFVSGTRAYDVVPTDALAESAARAFGEFAAALGDLDPAALSIPLPGFHDLERRLEQLEVAACSDRAGRAASVSRELDSVRALGRTVADALAAEGVLQRPQRVVHNDCKINNLLFDAATDQPLCVVDLDTVMPGPLLVDFGELVRTATCSASEDERDLSLVDFDAQRFAALARGYVAGLAGFATPAEIETLWLGGPWMATENAARFLADYLDGDLYFPARRTHHNLIRTRAQFHLAEQLWTARTALRAGLERARAGRA